MIRAGAGSTTHPYEREQDLAAALSSGDPEAWTQLFHDNYNRVFQYAYLRTGSQADADDVASSVFVEAVKEIKRFQFRGVPVAAWLFRIARNETADLLKRRSRANSASLSNEAVSRALRARDVLGPADDLRDVVKAMGRLKDEYHDVITLRFVEGLAVSEVAAIMGKSQGAVKVQQARALRALRTRLGT